MNIASFTWSFYRDDSKPIVVTAPKLKNKMDKYLRQLITIEFDDKKKFSVVFLLIGLKIGF
jgi:hypothetical protein